MRTGVSGIVFILYRTWLVYFSSICFFRDVQNIWPVVVNAWMYLTPLFYTIDILPKPLASLVAKVNPMYMYITIFRDTIVYGHYPWDVLVWRGLVVAILMLLIGIWSFSRAEDKFILHI